MRAREKDFIYVVKGIRHIDGHCWSARLPSQFGKGDSANNPDDSSLILLEDGNVLGPASALHERIRNWGRGLYSHWEGILYFSSSDNTDPRRNGRTYTAISIAGLLNQPEVSRGIKLTLQMFKGGSSSERYDALEKLIVLSMPEYKPADWGRSYASDERLLSIYSGFEESWRSYDRKFNVYNLIRLVEDVTGDMAECGVFQGSMSRFMAQAIKDYGLDCELRLFDSFQGLSQPKDVDGGYWKKGDMSSSLDEVKTNLSEFSFISYYKGWIPKVFDGLEEHKYRFVHVDVDLYQPTLESVRYFYPRLAVGGVMVCDDYGFETCKGARRAIDEFFSDRPEKVVHLSSGQGFVIKK